MCWGGTAVVLVPRAAFLQLQGCVLVRLQRCILVWL